MKFVDVTNDVAFRKIFGNENKQTALISFLNAILNLSGSDTIASVTIKSPIQLPEYSHGKSTIVDVKATDQNKNTFIVEMQVADVDGLDKRLLYYASKSYTDQIERGDLYLKLKPTFLIAILANSATQNPHYLSRHKILDQETGEHFVKDVEFSFVELSKFNKTEDELNTIVEQWVYFLKNAENLHLIPEKITDKGLQDAFIQADKHNWTKDELEAYDKIFMREQDDRGRFELGMRRAEQKGLEKGMEKGMEIGVEKGMEIGVEKGVEKNKYEVIDNGIAIGLSLEQLSKLTGFEIAEIEAYISGKI